MVQAEATASRAMRRPRPRVLLALAAAAHIESTFDNAPATSIGPLDSLLYTVVSISAGDRLHYLIKLFSHKLSSGEKILLAVSITL